MGFNFVCPRCAATVVVDTLPVTVCPRCEGNLAIADDERPAPERAPRPLILTIGMYLSGFFGIIGLLAFISNARVDLTLSDATMSGTRGRILTGIVGVLLVAIAYSLWTHRRWSRPLMMAFWIVLILSFAVVSSASCATFLLALFFIAAWFTLYVTDRPARYYVSLKAIHEWLR